jgi:hypothetical protein
MSPKRHEFITLLATQESITLPGRVYLKVLGTVLGLTAPPSLFYDLHFIC